MSKPVWAMSRSLRKSGIPHAYELAMMLAKRVSTDDPVTPDDPYSTVTFQSLGGSYVSKVGFQINTADMYETTTEFAVGEFPLQQSFDWQNNFNDEGYNTNKAYLDLQITDFGQPTKVGDFIKLRYMLPEVTQCYFVNMLGTWGHDANHYTFEMQIQGEESKVFRVTHSTLNGKMEWINSDDALFTQCDYASIKDGNNLLGLELTGWLTAPITAIQIKITAYDSTDEDFDIDNDLGWNYSRLELTYSDHDNLTVKAYEIPIPVPPSIVGYLYNDVQLPSKPEHDRGMPYEYIVDNGMSYIFYCTTNRPSLMGNIVGVGDGGYGYSQHFKTEEAFTEWYAVKYNGGATISGKSELLWTNTDILDADGNVFMHASEPIPVYE